MSLTSSVSLILVAASVLFSLAINVLAHQTKSGWTYPPACCKGHDLGGDCERIPDTDVTKRPRGFSVLLHPGEHYLVTRNQLFFIPYGDEIPSEDGDFHICLHPTDDPTEADGIGRSGRYHMKCFFAPPDSA